MAQGPPQGYQKPYQGSYQGGPKPGGPPMNPIVNLQVYQPPKPKPRPIIEEDPNKLDTSLFLPTMAPGPFFPPQYNMLDAMINPQVPMAPTIIKNYNINASGPTDLHDKISYIYEDMLPTINIPGHISTLEERNVLQHYLRSILFIGGDGRDMNLDERSNSLMQYMKYMEMNPYSRFKLEPNPLKTSPNNFLLYRSCYPIIRENGIVKCAKNSIGVHLRIYGISQAEYEAFSTNNKLTDFAPWREIKYYEYIREHIIKKNKCPNFINLYGYYVNQQSNIDFAKLNSIKGIEPVKPESTYIRLDPANPGQGLMGAVAAANVQNGGINLIGNNPQYVPNPNAYHGKALIALTEAPLYNILEWASTNYVRNGPAKRMISTGFYNENVWYSVLFQIMVALYLLQKHEIYFNNFNIQDNVFIKDLSLHSNLTNFWKYSVNGIDYYIPNYGFVAMLDTSFGDDLLSSDINHKIFAKPLGDESDDTNNIKKLIYENIFKKIFNKVNFTKPSFLDAGGMRPPPSIEKLLDQINKGCRDDNGNEIYDIIYYIEMFFSRFINNRVGTYLRELEIQNIRRDETNFEKGVIAVNEVGANTFKFVLVLGPDEDSEEGNRICVLTKTDGDNNYKSVIVPKSTLLGYNRGETIEQTFKPNENNLSEDELIETYTI